MTTAEILAACRRGDRGAEETLFHQYFSRLIGLARRRLPRGLGRRVDPEDVVLSAYRSFFVGLREGSGFASTETAADLWALLVTITRRKITKQARRHLAQRRSVKLETAEASPEVTDPGDPAEAAAILADEIDQLVATLGETDRQILVQLLEGVDSTEIARERGCSERTVRRSRERIDQAIALRREAHRQGNFLARPPSANRLETTGLTPTHRETDILLEQLVGKGGSAKVYRALDRTSGETVAVKFLRKDRWCDPRAVAALLREYQILRDLRHPGIVAIRGWGTTCAGAFFLVLEWVDGETLEAWHRRNPPLTEMLAAAASIAEALIEAHQRGILHGDLSPANILRNQDGRILLADFGFARWSDRRDDPRLRGGTSGFVAPEVLGSSFAENSPRQDVYGFSALLFWLLTGAALPGATSGSIDDEECRRRDAIRSSCGNRISEVLQQLILAGLARDPDQRPVGIGPYQDALRQELTRTI